MKQKSNEKTINNRLSKTNIALMTTHGLNNIISIFVGTFLVSYIYSISENYVLNVGLFYMSNYLVMGVVMYFVSVMIDRTNRVSLYRIAVLIRTVFIVIVLFTGRQLAGLVILAGALYGISEAFYWGSYNLMKNELVRRSLMPKFASYQKVMTKVGDFAIPLILGKIIDADSFKSSAIIILIVVILELISTMFIISQKPDGSSFDIKGFCRNVKGLGEKKYFVNTVLILTCFVGAVSAISVLNTIITMLTYGSNFSLGIFTSIFSVASLVYFVVISKFTKTGKRKVLFLITAFVPMIASIVLMIYLNQITTAIFNGLYSILSVTYDHTYDIHRNAVMKNFNMYDDIAEFQCTIEVIMEFVRAVIFGLMAIIGALGAGFGSGGMIIALKVILGVSVLAYVFANFILMKYEDKLVENNLA
ncbi:MAG: MFS transporter [Clostridia bacterium]|nr:MFS transporter [Clostridia bacterium]